MEPTYKLKLKIGPNEFDAEGPPELVQEQFRAFKELILEAANLARALPTSAVAPQVVALPVARNDDEASEARQELNAATDNTLGKIMRVENRIVSLTVRTRTVDDAILLLVYGQKMLRQNESVTGSEIISGLTMSGLPVPRVDRQLEKAGEVGDLIVVGIRRAKRYRITNAGISKARTIARDLIATVA